MLTPDNIGKAILSVILLAILAVTVASVMAFVRRSVEDLDLGRTEESFRCEVCDDWRPFDKIDVDKRQVSFPEGGGYTRLVNYCNDRQECIDGKGSVA